MQLSRRASRLLTLLLAALVVGVSAWMAYALITEGADPANEQRREEVERQIEREAEATRDSASTVGP